jgi:hypothetical protein
MFSLRTTVSETSRSIFKVETAVESVYWAPRDSTRPQDWQRRRKAELHGVTGRKMAGFKSNNNGNVCYPNILAIATDNLYFFILFCLFTTCFGSYGPSSGESQ